MADRIQKTDGLDKLAQRLRKGGLEDAALRLEALMWHFESQVRRGSWFSRKKRRLGAIMTRHRRNAETELQETGHLFSVARRMLVDQQPVPDAELEQAREQLLDLLKTVPASAVVAGTFLIPFPGAQPVLAPILMERLGLLPSAWSESRMERELRDLSIIALSHGQQAVADGLKSVLESVKSDGRKLKQLEQWVSDCAEWKVFFDEDLDGKVRREELVALRRRIEVTALDARVAGDREDWYVYYKSEEETFDPERTTEFRLDYKDETVKGPKTLDSILAEFGARKEVLVRRGDSGWWVPLFALKAELES